MRPFIQLISKYVEENDIERPQEVVVKSAARKSMNKLFIIQHVDRRTPLDSIAQMKGLDFVQLLENLEQIVYSGTKLNIDYYIEDRVDEDHEDDIFDYFMSAESDDLDEAENELGPEIHAGRHSIGEDKIISEVGN